MDAIQCELPRDADLPPCDARIAALHGYWRRIRPAGGRLPGRQHLDPVDIPKLLPWIWMIDVQRAPLRFKYRLMGTEQVRVVGRDHTGAWLDVCYPQWAAGPTYSQFQAAAQGMIAYRRGVPLPHAPKEHLLTERILLPLARDGETVDILVALSVFTLARTGAPFPGATHGQAGLASF